MILSVLMNEMNKVYQWYIESAFPLRYEATE